ncbi:MAG: ATP-dependent DNA helicase [Thermoplasmata archaeon]|nr:ATP-dependent DNA helicase [Thermoplasmata archaeon]
MERAGELPTTSADIVTGSTALFPYRLRPGQEPIVRSVAEVARTGGALLIDAATGSGKTVATLAPLLEHAEKADHRILYLVRTHAQEVQVLQEARAISHRLEHPILALGLEGRQRRCFLLEAVPEIKGATAEEHGKLCADRKRATQRAFDEGTLLTPPPELPEEGPDDLTDLDGCAYYARVLQADLDALTERFSAKLPSPSEFNEYSRSENLCPYELSKKLASRARILTAPYAFFFHPHIRQSLLAWMGVSLDRVDLVIDEAHNVPDQLRELATVSLPQESVRRARAELAERGDFQLPDGPGAARFLEIVQHSIDQLVERLGDDEDGILPPNALEDTLLTEIGGTSHRLDTWLGALASWGEALREEKRRQRRLPRSWVHTVALTLLSWPQLEPPGYVKVVSRAPRRALEAYALDARAPAEAVRGCHVSVHLSGTLAPLQEYRESLGLGESAKLLSVPSQFPPQNRKFLYDTELTTRFEDLRSDPSLLPRLADRLAEILQDLPVKTAIFFPSFDLMNRVLSAGLQSALPPGHVIESPRVPMADLWRSVEVFKKGPEGGVLLGVTGGRIAEGLDFPDEELEAVVVVGIPYPKPTAKREALRRFLDQETGHGWEYCHEAPAQRAILQAFGRMIRSENDRGIAIVVDRRAPTFASVLPGLAPLGDLRGTAKQFYARRARWIPLPAGPVAPAPLSAPDPPKA